MGIMSIPPRHPGHDLHQIHVMDLRARWSIAVRIGSHHLAECATVAITLAADNLHLAVENHGGQVGLRLLAKGLSLLGSVNAGQTNLVLLALAVKQGNRIAVGNADHLPGQGTGANG